MEIVVDSVVKEVQETQPRKGIVSAVEATQSMVRSMKFKLEDPCGGAFYHNWIEERTTFEFLARLNPSFGDVLNLSKRELPDLDCVFEMVQKQRK